MQKICSDFYCDICDYKCSRLFLWKQHISTRKHKMVTNDNKMVTKNMLNCVCGRTYKYRSGLSRHFKKCPYIVDNSKNLVQLIHNEKIKKLEEKNSKLELALLDQQKTMDILAEQLPKLVEATVNIAKRPLNVNNTNCNNKMTINMYLNQECKNAMNLTDFVENVKISIEDLMYTQQHGYVKGISNILAKQLKDMDPKKRPIHCSDKKRMQFYVKEEDKWEKDKEHKKIDKSIAKIKHNQILKIREWEDVHPNFTEDCQLIKVYNKMIAETMGSWDNDNDNNNIKKQMSTIIEVKENMKD